MSSGIVCVRYSRDLEEGCDRPKYVYIALRGIVESGCIDQNDTTTVEIESLCHLCGACTRSQSSTNAKFGPADEVNELYKPRV